MKYFNSHSNKFMRFLSDFLEAEQLDPFAHHKACGLDIPINGSGGNKAMKI